MFQLENDLHIFCFHRDFKAKTDHLDQQVLSVHKGHQAKWDRQEFVDIRELQYEIMLNYVEVARFI